MASSGTPGALVLSSSVVDVTSQSQTIDVTVELTDDLSGIASATLNWLQHRPALHSRRNCSLRTWCPAIRPTASTADHDRPGGHRAGDYVLQEVWVQDAAGNYVQYLVQISRTHWRTP